MTQLKHLNVMVGRDCVGTVLSLDLGDGSTVWDVRLEVADNRLTLSMDSEESARRLATFISEHCLELY